MDYEEKYNKLVEAVKVLQETNPSDEGIQNWVNDNVPELIESEDERIRKEIYWFFTQPDTVCDKRWIAWLEKQGEPTDINPSEFDLHLNKLLKQFETLPKEELASSLSFYLNVIQNDGTYREEKQGEQNPNVGISPQLSPQLDDQRSTDNNEPQFHEGDWVVYNNDICQIVKREEGCNKLVTVFGIEKELVNERELSTAHLWTIDDAKDGDVLADNVGVILFKSIRDNNVINYYAYLSGLFAVQKGEEYWGYVVNCTLSPATKEQRERFFAAMHEAGYEWDADKKELKKIENETEISFGAKDSELQEVTYFIPQGFHAEIDDDKVVIKKSEKPTVWSEEDECYMSECVGAIATKDGWSFEEKRKTKHWLKSLKNRITWKPSKEQIDAFEHFVRSIGESDYGFYYDNNTKLIYSLLEQLKQL